MAYKKIELVSFLKRLDRIFLENPDLWYEFILPKEKAEEFRIKYKNNYSKIWHEHFSECWATISLKSKICYYDEEKSDHFAGRSVNGSNCPDWMQCPTYGKWKCRSCQCEWNFCSTGRTEFLSALSAGQYAECIWRNVW